MLITLLKREFKKHYLRPQSSFTPIIFFILVCFVFSFSQPDEIRNNTLNGLCVVLCSIILAYCIATSNIFEDDYNSGCLQMLYCNLGSKITYILSKIFSGFLFNGLIFALVAPVSMLFFKIDSNFTYYIFISILGVSFLLGIISVMIASLMIGLKNGGLIASILSIPLYLPIIIISVSFFENITNGETDLTNFLKNIFGLSLIYLPLSIFSANYCIKLAAED